MFLFLQSTIMPGSCHLRLPRKWWVASGGPQVVGESSLCEVLYPDQAAKERGVGSLTIVTSELGSSPKLPRLEVGSSPKLSPLGNAGFILTEKNPTFFRFNLNLFRD